MYGWEGCDGMGLWLTAKVLPTPAIVPAVEYPVRRFAAALHHTACDDNRDDKLGEMFRMPAGQNECSPSGGAGARTLPAARVYGGTMEPAELLALSSVLVLAHCLGARRYAERSLPRHAITQFSPCTPVIWQPFVF